MPNGDATARRQQTRWGEWLYDRAEPYAHGIKVILQMLIGTGTVGLLGLKLAHLAGAGAPDGLTEALPLEIVGRGLEYAAGVELAYMLFTDGPDEAIQPLILGLSAATLLAVSGTLTATSLIAAPAFVLTIALLLWLKAIFFENGRDEASLIKTGSAEPLVHESEERCG